MLTQSGLLVYEAFKFSVLEYGYLLKESLLGVFEGHS